MSTGCRSVRMSVCLSACLCLSVSVCVCVSFFRSFFLSACLSVCLSVCLWVPVCVCVCLSFFLFFLSFFSFFSFFLSVCLFLLLSVWVFKGSSRQMQFPCPQPGHQFWSLCVCVSVEILNTNALFWTQNQGSKNISFFQQGHANRCQPRSPSMNICGPPRR